MTFRIASNPSPEIVNQIPSLRNINCRQIRTSDIDGADTDWFDAVSRFTFPPSHIVRIFRQTVTILLLQSRFIGLNKPSLKTKLIHEFSNIQILPVCGYMQSAITVTARATWYPESSNRNPGLPSIISRSATKTCSFSLVPTSGSACMYPWRLSIAWKVQ